MSDELDLDDNARAAIKRVVASSASDAGSERFRLQLAQELSNAGVNLCADDLAAVQSAVVRGELG